MKKKQTVVCPYCRGKAIRSRDWVILDFPHFLKPWGSALKMDEKMVPWWCTNCGNITFRLKESEKVLEEYKSCWGKVKDSDEKKEIYHIVKNTN